MNQQQPSGGPPECQFGRLNLWQLLSIYVHPHSLNPSSLNNPGCQVHFIRLLSACELLFGKHMKSLAIEPHSCNKTSKSLAPNMFVIYLV